MSLLKKTKRKSRHIRGISRPLAIQIGCGFCWELLPRPEVRHDAFTGDGCLGGRCECGAVFVVDETGREGGLARLDALALVCGGDLERATQLDADREVDFKTRDLSGRSESGGGRAIAQGQMSPLVWFARLKSEDPGKIKPTRPKKRLFKRGDR